MPSILAPAKESGKSSATGRRKSLDEILENPDLPSPLAVALQVVEKASQPDFKLSEIIALLRQDPGLCSRVLKTVNSGLFGLTQSVGTLQRAVTMLGTRPLRLLVLSSALPALQVRDPDALTLKYWQESVAGAVIARELAVILKRPEPEDDLVAGLLRDLGVQVLQEAFPEEYRAIHQRRAKDSTLKQWDEEVAAFGLDHAEIGAGLLNSWHLPPDIALPVRYHHYPERFAKAPKALEERAWLLCFASKVAVLEAPTPAAISELLQIARTRFKLDQATLAKFLASVQPTIRQFADVLKIDIGQCPNYSAILAAGCDELVRLSVEANRTPAPTGPVSELLLSEGPAVETCANGRVRTREAGQGPATLPEFDLDRLDALGPTGMSLNGYLVQEIIGRGGMGVVFKAYDGLLDRYVAVKMMTRERLVASDARDRFQREARASAAIHCENVVTIYAVSELNGVPYLVMEYLPGPSLQSVLEDEGSPPIADIIRYGRQIANGLRAAHERRVVHRDIKPANVIVDRDADLVKITDFGLARVLDETRLSHDGHWVGTPLYMAPEQFESGVIDHRADLFSLGSLLYTLCACRTPFTGDAIPAVMHQVCSATPPPLRQFRSDIPGWFDQLIMKLLAKQARLRYQSALEVMHAIDAQQGQRR